MKKGKSLQPMSEMKDLKAMLRPSSILLFYNRIFLQQFRNFCVNGKEASARSRYIFIFTYTRRISRGNDLKVKVAGRK